MGEVLRRRRLRVPKEHGAIFAVPPLSEAPRVLRDNVACSQAWQATRLTVDARPSRGEDLLGQSLQSLARSARREMLEAAIAYTRSYRDVGSRLLQDAGAPLILSGHQPQLFHPGVWVKNFALDRIARDVHGIAVNLIIDNDVVRSTAIRVPTGSIENPASVAVAYDAPAVSIPSECRDIVDPSQFRGFGKEAAAAIAPFVADPLVHELWPLAVEQSPATPNLGACLAAARHRLEGAWGLETLEISLGRLCRLRAFFWLTCHMIAHLPRFWEIHNDALRHYRTIGHVRSSAHPVPDLASDGPWLEAPFWLWHRDDPQRRRLFAKVRGDEIELTDRANWRLALPLSADTPGDAAVDRLADAADAGARLRPRALVTTMVARLLLSDLFVHGIGGAKYDELTDQIIGRFYGQPAPAYCIVSATLRLPFSHEPAAREDVRDIQRQLRELTYQPERWLARQMDRADAATRSRIGPLLAAKQQWIDETPTPQTARKRFLAITEINRRLQPEVQQRRVELLARRDRQVEALRRDWIFSSREYAFCLFPKDQIQRNLTQMVGSDVPPTGQKRQA